MVQLMAHFFGPTFSKVSGYPTLIYHQIAISENYEKTFCHMVQLMAHFFGPTFSKVSGYPTLIYHQIAISENRCELCYNCHKIFRYVLLL